MPGDGDPGGPGNESGNPEDGQDTLLTVPRSLRSDLRDPLGPVVTTVPELLDGRDAPAVVAVGDVVTAHLLDAGVRPDLAVIDGRTERSAVEESVAATLDAHDAPRTGARNDPGTLSADLLGALRDALDATGPRVVVVDGEEDLAVLPLVLLAPDGALLTYGQPGEGMVRVDVDADARERVQDLLERADPDDRLWTYV